MKNALHAALQLLKSCNAISAQVSGLAAGMGMEREMKRRLKSGLAAHERRGRNPAGGERVPALLKSEIGP